MSLKGITIMIMIVNELNSNEMKPTVASESVAVNCWLIMNPKGLSSSIVKMYELF